jgi:hypothetical protein
VVVISLCIRAELSLLIIFTPSRVPPFICIIITFAKSLAEILRPPVGEKIGAE